MIPKKTLIKLEYPAILETLAGYSKTYLGKSLCLDLFPYAEEAKVKKALIETSEGVSFLVRRGSLPIAEIPCIEIQIKALKSEQTLSAKSLLQMASVLKMAREIKESFEKEEDLSQSDYTRLFSYITSLYGNLSIEKRILACILDEVTIADDASSKLLQIRREKKKLEEQIRNKLNSILTSKTYGKYLQEPVITIRNERFVIPVKEECRSLVKGLIHDMSASGSTVFVEPMAIFEANNAIHTLQAEEAIEIELILQELSNLFVPIIGELENNLRLIGILDFIFAKARYAIALDAIEPILNSKKQISLQKARHPLLNPKQVVPIDVELGSSYSCLVITGPNTGGKTVSLKTVGLLTLMGMSGLHIPAKEKSSISVFDYVFADMGDEQSIGESLSTFSSHMLNLIECISSCHSNSLILVDELGSGTDPVEGSNLAISILETFYQKGSLVMATTHYPELKKYALLTDGFENASSEFDVALLKPTYRLLVGIPGKSNAFAISKRLGLPNSILDRANELMAKEDTDMEELLKQIYDDKLVIEKEKEEIDKNLLQVTTLRKNLEEKQSHLDSKEEEKLEKAKREAREILSQAKEEASYAMKQIRNWEKTAPYELDQIRNRLTNSMKNLNNPKAEKKSSTNNDHPLDISALQIGMPVYLTSLGQEAILLSLPNKSEEVEVQMGSLKTKIPVATLSHSKQAKKTTTNSKTSHSNFKAKTIQTEIHVLGQTVEEANLVIDKFLDDAALAKLEAVRIVHGKGTGKLREGIHTFLKRHPHVKSYRMGTFGEGEMGVTIVEIK